MTEPTCLLEPPLTEAERPPRRLSCASTASAHGNFATLKEWEDLWEQVRALPLTKKRVEALTLGITGLRFWLGNVRLPLLIPPKPAAFEKSGFMRWYGAIERGIADLPPSQAREDTALFLRQDVLPLLMRMDPCAERRDFWLDTANDLAATKNCRV